MNYSAGISRFFRIFCCSYFFCFWPQVRCKKININSVFFFFFPICISSISSNITSAPQISWKPDLEGLRAVGSGHPSAFRSARTAPAAPAAQLPRAHLPSHPQRYFCASKGRVLCLFPTCAGPTAAERLRIHLWGRSKTSSGFCRRVDGGAGNSCKC